MRAAEEIRALLRARGAETIEHPGGTLYDHLNRVERKLDALGLGVRIRLAGLGHAVYGTDGFDVALLSLTERGVFAELASERVEAVVYTYAACDRRRTWRALAQERVVWDRFTGEPIEPADEELRDFADLSVVNELDLVEHSPEIEARYGGYFREVFGSWREIVSPEVLAECERRLGWPA